jgi:hypothetical protein
MNAIKNFLEGLQPKPEGPSNAIDLLKQDHSRVKQMLEKFLELEEEQEKASLLKTIIEELTVHAELEEELVYPLLRNEDEDLTLESLEEHHVVKLLLGELSELNAGDNRTKAKVKVLNELVKQHIQEEESQAFPELEETDTDFQQLGQEIMQRKEELQSSMAKRPGRKRTSRHTKSKTTGARAKTTSRGQAKTASTSKTKGKSSSSSSSRARKPSNTRSSRSKSASAGKGKSSGSTRSKSAATTARSKSAVSTNQKRSTRTRRRMPSKKAS